MINRCTPLQFAVKPLLLYSVCYRAFLIQIKMEHLIDTCWGDESEHQQYLNRKASEGWELVNVLQEKESDFFKYFFKRDNSKKELKHFKDTVVGLYATDKEPEKLFEEVFVHLIEKIGMDGEKTFSPMDYEYYKEMFNKGIKMLMWRIS